MLVIQVRCPLLSESGQNVAAPRMTLSANRVISHRRRASAFSPSLTHRPMALTCRVEEPSTASIAEIEPRPKTQLRSRSRSIEAKERVVAVVCAGWAIATGVLQIMGAIRLRKEIDNEWFLILGGIISVMFGVGILVVPGAGALALVWVIDIYAIILGALFVAAGYRLKKHIHA